jgi:CDP-diacylglycerol--glycerol-3-phosphate 3-phosphatidyltransferase
MGIYAIKPRFRAALTGVARSLADRGYSPNQITTAGLVAGVAAVGCYGATRITPLFLIGIPVLAFVRIAANALDGLVAEIAHKARPSGELYNEIADRLADAAFIVGSALVGGVNPALAVAALAAAEFASFVGVTAKAVGTVRRYDGPMGKPDRMAIIGVAAVFALFVTPGSVFNLGLAVVIVGSMLTAVNRYVKAHKELERAR